MDRIVVLGNFCYLEAQTGVTTGWRKLFRMQGMSPCGPVPLHDVFALEWSEVWGLLNSYQVALGRIVGSKSG